MSVKDEVFKNALAGKKIPILTLDNKWHKIFDEIGATARIKSLEGKLNELVKRQGKAGSESKDVKKIKRKLMDEVVLIADGLVQNPDNKKLQKDREEHKRLIEECNTKLTQYEDDLIFLPREIDSVNRQLMIETMELCYKKIQENERELSYINDWIKNIRRELKKNMVRKQEKEEANYKLYSYMHDIFGAEVLEVFDMKYDPEKMKKEKDADDKKAGEGRKKKKAGNVAPES